MVAPKNSIAALFLQIRNDQTHAFNELFLIYYKRLVLFANQYVKNYEAAEELTAGVFVKLWQKRHTLNQLDKPEVYLYVSVKNAALNYLRSTKKLALLSVDEPTETAFINHIPAGRQSSDLDQKELRLKLREAIEALPEQRRLIFKLIKEDGLKCREVAEILNLSTRTVESQLYKAVKFLADRLSVYLGYHPQKTGSRKALLSVSIFYLFV